MLTKINLISGTVFTDLTPDEVRQYLSAGTRTGVIRGYTDTTASVNIYIAVHAIETVEITQVART
jgi:hypothetical protein